MIVRILKIETPKATWYETQVRILGFIWVDGNVYRPGFPSYFSSLDDAMEKLDDLKKKKVKKVVSYRVEI